MTDFFNYINQYAGVYIIALLIAAVWFLEQIKKNTDVIRKLIENRSAN